MISADTSNQPKLLKESQHQVFRLKDLYNENRGLFREVIEFMPFAVYLENRKSLKISYSNSIYDSWAGSEGEIIKAKGLTGLEEISDPDFLAHALNKIKLLERVKDPSFICSTIQYLKFDGIMTFFYSNKIILNKDNYLNVGFTFSGFDKYGAFIEEILLTFVSDKNNWSKLKSLTKQEKNVLNLISNGLSNEVISEQLCISLHTVRTHRKSVYRKLEIESISDLIVFAQALELL